MFSLCNSNLWMLSRAIVVQLYRSWSTLARCYFYYLGLLLHWAQLFARRLRDIVPLQSASSNMLAAFLYFSICLSWRQICTTFVRFSILAWWTLWITIGCPFGLSVVRRLSCASCFLHHVFLFCLLGRCIGWCSAVRDAHVFIWEILTDSSRIDLLCWHIFRLLHIFSIGNAAHFSGLRTRSEICMCFLAEWLTILKFNIYINFGSLIKRLNLLPHVLVDRVRFLEQRQKRIITNFA